MLSGGTQPSVAHRIIGVRRSIPADKGESRFGSESRLARQRASAASAVPYTRNATSSMVSSGRAIVNSDAGLRAGAGFRCALEAATLVGCPCPGTRTEACRRRPGGESKPPWRDMSLPLGPRTPDRGSGDLEATRSRSSEAESPPVSGDIALCLTPRPDRSRLSLCGDRVLPRAGGMDERVPGSRTDERARLKCVGGRSRWKRATAKKHTIITLKTMLGPAWRLMALVRQKSAVQNTKL
jgi:hypothetical protein